MVNVGIVAEVAVTVAAMVAVIFTVTITVTVTVTVRVRAWAVWREGRRGTAPSEYRVRAKRL